MKKYKLLIVDDDLKLGGLITEYLSSYGHQVRHISNPNLVIESLSSFPVDLVILDIMMPNIDGLELCKLIRKDSSVPIIFLSARSETIDRIIGLELGADDYLPKPFEPRELLARIDSILRRSGGASQNLLTQGRLQVNTDSMEVLLDDKKVDLTSNEFLALKYLVDNKNKIIHRDDLLTFIQGYDSEVYGRAIDILISRIRAKLFDNPKDPHFIKTIRGQGYRFIGS